MADRALRGMTIGAKSMESEDGVEFGGDGDLLGLGDLLHPLAHRDVLRLLFGHVQHPHPLAGLGAVLRRGVDLAQQGQRRGLLQKRLLQLDLEFSKPLLQLHHTLVLLVDDC